MRAFLLTIAVLSFINTACVLWASITGNLKPVEPWARAVDAIMTAGFGCWALWLLSAT